MKHRLRLLCLALFLALAALAAAPGSAQAPSERQRIEALLDHVEHLPGARFIRNGSEYDAPSAARYLRHKWGEVSVNTAEEFITRVASTSSSSGQPYRIKLAGEAEQNFGDYLRSVLSKL